MHPMDDTALAPARAAAAGDNAAVADLLREMATLLEAQGEDNPFRIAAYRRAADTAQALRADLREVYGREGLAGLDALPAIGPGIAAAVAEILQTGRWARLERLRGAAGPEAIFRTVPGVGAQLAMRIHDELGLDTLEALEAAAHDGRLEGLPHVGPRRAASIRAALTQMLDRGRALRRRPRAAPPTAAAQGSRASAAAGGGSTAGDVDDAPSVADLLAVDRLYREGAAVDRLPKIAPRRFNPEGRAWLPVLHTRRGAWAFTALYSNTARAHELDRVHDWVVVYAEDASHHERQYTVVTAARGTLAGRRVVRGREDECQALYAA
jgi:hypothetical protein